MKIKSILIVCLTTMLLIGCTSIPKNMSREEFKELQDGLYANVETSKGDLLVQFFDKEAPVTVANFIGLAEGKKENKAKPLGEPFYDGLIFHRVIKDFMIQGGDPNGTGMGGPGYNFEDEVNNDLKHDKKGILSMANAGPNTNGSQFFITEVPTPWLDGKHTIFGQVIKGESVIDSIAVVEKGAQDKPKEDIVINKVEIIRKGKEYKDYEPNKAFAEGREANKRKQEELKKQKEREMQKEVERIKELSAKAETTESGLQYVILTEGEGENHKKEIL